MPQIINWQRYIKMDQAYSVIVHLHIEPKQRYMNGSNSRSCKLLLFVQVFIIVPVIKNSKHTTYQPVANGQSLVLHRRSKSWDWNHSESCRILRTVLVHSGLWKTYGGVHGKWGGTPSHKKAQTVIMVTIHFWDIFFPNKNHPAIEKYPHDYGPPP